MYAIIDRFEGDFAVCEINSEETVRIERCLLPQDAREGSAFVPGAKIRNAIQETLKRQTVVE